MPLTLTRGSHPASAHTRVIVTVSYVILLALGADPQSQSAVI